MRITTFVQVIIVAIFFSVDVVAADGAGKNANFRISSDHKNVLKLYGKYPKVDNPSELMIDQKVNFRRDQQILRSLLLDANQTLAEISRGYHLPENSLSEDLKMQISEVRGKFHKVNFEIGYYPAVRNVYCGFAAEDNPQFVHLTPELQQYRGRLYWQSFISGVKLYTDVRNVPLTITARCVKGFSLMNQLLANNSLHQELNLSPNQIEAARFALKRVWAGFIAHEITHYLDYQKDPRNDLSTLIRWLPDVFLDEESNLRLEAVKRLAVLDDMLNKVYDKEKRGFGIGIAITRADLEQTKAGIKVLESLFQKYRAKHPEKFQIKGEYSLLEDGESDGKIFFFRFLHASHIHDSDKQISAELAPAFVGSYFTSAPFIHNFLPNRSPDPGRIDFDMGHGYPNQAPHFKGGLRNFIEAQVAALLVRVKVSEMSGDQGDCQSNDPHWQYIQGYRNSWNANKYPCTRSGLLDLSRAILGSSDRWKATFPAAFSMEK